MSPRNKDDPDVFRQTLQEFSRALTLIVGEEELQQALAAKLREALELDRVAILLLDDAGVEFRIAASRGVDEQTTRGTRFSATGRLARWLKVNEEPLHVDSSPWIDSFLDPAERELLVELGCGLCFPLVAMNRLLGFVTLSRTALNGKAFDLRENEMQLINALAGQAALALENASLQRDRKTRLRRMYRAERLAATGQLAAGAAHEIRNPLASIRSAIQLIARDYQSGSGRHEMIGEIVTEVDRIDGIVEGLLTLARPEPVQYADVDLSEIIRQTLGLIGARARDQRVALEVEAPETLPLHADANLLKQLLLNLVLNAVDAMHEGGVLSVKAESSRRSARLIVRDTGIGIPESELERVFDPFFTTRKDGTGLGLAICHGIVDRHRGEISVESRPGEGTSFSIELPLRKGR